MKKIWDDPSKGKIETIFFSFHKTFSSPDLLNEQ